MTPIQRRPAWLRNAALSVLALIAAGFIGMLYFTRIPQEMMTRLVFKSISDSYIQANMPGKADFDKIVKLSFSTYFETKDGRKSSVSYEKLIPGASQVGVADPKMYFWVRRHDEAGRDFIDEGAARVAFIDKSAMEVLNYVSKQELIDHPGLAEKIFPPQAAKKIKLKLKP